MNNLDFDLQRFVDEIIGTESSDSITVNDSNQYVQALGGRDYIVINEANYTATTRLGLAAITALIIPLQKIRQSMRAQVMIPFTT